MTYLKNLLLLTCLLLCSAIAGAQVVYTEPAIVQQSTQNVKVYFDATKGTGGLMGEASAVYAHTGVLTNLSSNDSDWRYAPTWLDNSEKYKLTKVSTDLWCLTIPDIKSYYGVPANETVKKLCFVFRNATGSKEGKGDGGSDIFVEVHADGLSVSITTDATSNVLNDTNSKVTLTVNSSQSANLNLYLNDINSTAIASATNATTLSKTYTFPVGDFDVIAKAEAGGKTVLDTISVCHRSNSKQVAYSGTLLQGANKNADGSVTFCLNAPGKSNVILVGEWDNYRVLNSNLMNYQGNRYFWITIPAGKLDMNKQYGYYFIVDDNIMVADPYSKLVLDPWNDKYINEGYTRYPDLKPFPTSKVGTFSISVFCGNGYKYNWQVPNFVGPSKDNLMIYELLLRDFTDEQCLETAMAKLDYLKELGINAIELMPVQEFDGNNSWGYNPNFYFAPDKYYGSPVMYKKFIDECHKRDIAVILDVVFNHAYGQQPWCKMYWDGTNNKPAANNPFFNADAPHNWSVGNDWKQESTAVRDFLCDVLKYWIEEYKIDGYRFDLAKGLGDTNSYASDYDASKYNASRLANVKRFISAIQSANPNAYCIMEYFVDASEENAIANVGGMSWMNKNYAYTQAAKGYSSGSAFTGMFSGDYSRPFGSVVGYMESHDEERMAYEQKTSGSSTAKVLVYGMRRLASNAAFAFLVPGPKMIWQFGEMGYDVSINDPGRTDPKPTHWEYLDNSHRKGLHDSYKEILAIRTHNPELFSSDAEFYWSAGDANWASGRFITARNRAAGKELIVAYNPNTAQKTFTYTFDNPSGTYYIASKSYNTNPSFSASAGTITVPSHSYIVITNFDNSGVEDATLGDKDSAISIYPNPATDIVSVRADEVEAIEVFSISGQLVAKNAGEASIDVSSIARGNYIVRITTPEGVKVEKLLKK